MNENANSPEKRRTVKILSSASRITGTVLILAVALVLLPLFVVQLFGYKTYYVTSPSMSPTIPQGSLVFSKAVSPEDVNEGDVIVFGIRGSVTTHRVVENQKEKKQFITKGDANNQQDVTPIPYSALIGRVEKFIQKLGSFYSYLTGAQGRIVSIALITAGFLLQILGVRLGQAPEEEKSAEEGGKTPDETAEEGSPASDKNA